MTVEIEINDEDFKELSEYAAEQNFTLSEFLLNLANEKIRNKTISNEDLFRISDKIISQRKKVYEVLAK